MKWNMCYVIPCLYFYTPIFGLVFEILYKREVNKNQ